MRVVWSAECAEDLAALRAFIAADSPAAAKRMIRRIAQTVETLLPQNPEIDRRGRAPGTRELVIAPSPFVVAYRLRDETIQVLRVFHGSRRWPDRL